MSDKPDLESKPALTIKEFAEFFGRSKRWGYDRIYHGDVKVLKKKSVVTMIPRSEVLRFLGDVEEYSGKRPSVDDPEKGEMK